MKDKPAFRLLTLFLMAALTCGAACRGEPAANATEPVPVIAPATPEEPVLHWRDVTTWGVEGRAWTDLERERWFDRFPAVADGKVTEKVWNLSRDSTGMMVRFKTDASMIWVDYTLHREKLNGSNMTPVGASGLDLYARDENRQWRWVGVARPGGEVVRQMIIEGLAPDFREYALYLPLYNGVENLSIGVPPEAEFHPMPPREIAPIVFYGTSITQGASASRPGMVHTAILGRRFDRPVVNLGFSGNGRMDAEVGELLVLIDAAVYVIDCLPNMGPDSVREKCIPLVEQLRAARPDTPIILVEDRRYTNSWIRPDKDRFHTNNHAALRECFEKLQAGGVTGLFYIPGDDLLGDDAEGATDGSHPNDLGFVRQAAIFEPVLREALAGR
ncbi:MAG: SGNH/GDSL hydrolase family protein [Opitutaceae bacterium]